MPLRGRVLARVEASAFRILACLIGISFAARLVAGWSRATPNYFPDEYLYAELARSLLESGRPAVRSVEIGFPALLQPVLTAPTWLVGDVVVSYRLTQALGALAMSLVALPVFALSRKLDIGRPLALAAAALSLAVPDLVFASWVMAEPFAYPLFVGVVLAGTVALSEPSRRHGLLLVALVALAAFARAQFAILPLCFVAAVFLVGLRERRLRFVLREQAFPLGAFAGVGLAVALIGVGRVLGLYRSALDGRADPVELLERVGTNALVLAYASGWILVPGALLGLALVLGRPRSRAELAFGAIFLTTAVALLLEAGLAGAVENAQERYVFYVIPLAAIAFCLYASRGWPARTSLALITSLLIVASSQVPLAGLTAAEGKTQSPFLLAAFRFEEVLGSPGSGSLTVALAAAILGIAVIVLSARPTLATSVALTVALTASVAASAGAVAFDNRNSASVRAAFLPVERSWVTAPVSTTSRWSARLKASAPRHSSSSSGTRRSTESSYCPARRRSTTSGPHLSRWATTGASAPRVARLPARCSSTATAERSSSPRPTGSPRRSRSRSGDLMARRGCRSTWQAATATAGWRAPAGSSSGPSAPEGRSSGE